MCPQSPVPGAVQRGRREAAFLTVSLRKLFSLSSFHLQSFKRKQIGRDILSVAIVVKQQS